MNRQSFLKSVTGLISLPSLAFSTNKVDRIIPPYLRKGDVIGITAPAGYITMDEIKPSTEQMRSWGFDIKIGSTIGKRDFTFGGTDQERAQDFQDMLDDPKVNAIMCARGGYGAVRIIDRLNWDKFRKKPKWIIGFSDITVFHAHIDRHFGIASIHSKMCNSFPDDWSRAEPIQKETILSIERALKGVLMDYQTIPHHANRSGEGFGSLIGGNLKMLETLSGTSSEIDTKGKILFLEDTGEYMYNIDRMMWNLKRTGKLGELKGLIIGGFKVKIDDGGDEFGRTLQDVVLEKVKDYNYPVCFDFPVGHQRNNFALKCGIMHKLSVNATECCLTEIK